MGLIHFYTEEFRVSQPDRESVPSSSHSKPEPVNLSKLVVKLCIHQSGDLAAKFEYNAVSGCLFCLMFLIQLHIFRMHCLFCEPCSVLVCYYSHVDAMCRCWSTWSLYCLLQRIVAAVRTVPRAEWNPKERYLLLYIDLSAFTRRPVRSGRSLMIFCIIV
jgi:hypothetical protein